MIDIDAFLDELEKIGQQRGLMSDFLAGVDPTGTRTFQYGMQDVQQQGGPSALRRAVGGVGGVVGGAAAIPAAVGGVVGGIKGFAMGKGGIGRRLAEAGRSALTGAAKPYKSLYQGVQARRALAAHQAGRQLTGRQAGHLSRFVEGQMPSGLVGRRLTSQEVQRGLQAMTPAQIAEARRQLTGEIAGGAGALGLSGAISGGSAYMQYGKGAKTQQDVNRQIAAAKAAPAAVRR